MQAKLLKPRMSRRVLLSMSPQEAVNLKYLTMFPGTVGNALAEADDALSADRVAEFITNLNDTMTTSLARAGGLPRCDLFTTEDEEEDTEEEFEREEPPEVLEAPELPTEDQARAIVEFTHNLMWQDAPPNLAEADVFPDPPRREMTLEDE